MERESQLKSASAEQTVEKGKEVKEASGEKLAVAKPCIFAQQSASHAANAAKKGWRTPFSFKITPRRARRTGPQALFVGSLAQKRSFFDKLRHNEKLIVPFCA